MSVTPTEREVEVEMLCNAVHLNDKMGEKKVKHNTKTEIYKIKCIMIVRLYNTTREKYLNPKP